MSVTAVIITKGGHPHLVDCVRSVYSYVDEVLILDNGLSPSERKRLTGCNIEDYTWPGSFAQAKNDALEHVFTDWALIVDDDWVFDWHISAAEFRDFLDSHNNRGIVHIWGGSYYTGRLLNISRGGITWTGRAHEYPQDSHHRKPLYTKKITFKERPRTPEQTRVKFERDKKLLLEQAQEEPNESRWQYYLGSTYEALGQSLIAIKHYQACISTSKWDEEAAYAAFRMACCYETLDDYETALSACLAGVKRHAGMAELYWLAGVCCYRLGNPNQARRFALLANMFHAGTQDEEARIFFRYEPALYEGPYDILRYIDYGKYNEGYVSAYLMRTGKKPPVSFPPPTGEPVSQPAPVGHH